MIDKINAEQVQIIKEIDALLAETDSVIKSLLDKFIDRKTANAKIKEFESRRKALNKRSKELFKFQK